MMFSWLFRRKRLFIGIAKNPDNLAMRFSTYSRQDMYRRLRVNHPNAEDYIVIDVVMKKVKEQLIEALHQLGIEEHEIPMTVHNLTMQLQAIVDNGKE